jgi:Ser/Thr protein kinase RdoA (MazF antagonist)
MVEGQRIGQGRTAEVYAWGEGRVLKLYRPECPKAWTAYEVSVVRALTGAGVAAPAVLGTVEVEGRAGIVFERVAGRSLGAQVIAAPWRTGRAGKLLARMHGALHARPIPAPLPRLKEKLAETLGEVREALGADAERTAATLDLLPDGDRVCHYDFHPENVLGEGPDARAIDWNNAALGDPVADVARTLVILRSPHFPPGVPVTARALVMGLKRWLARAYEAEYRRRFGLPADALAAWMVPVAAARLAEEIPGEREYLLAIVRQGREA